MPKVCLKPCTQRLTIAHKTAQSVNEQFIYNTPGAEGRSMTTYGKQESLANANVKRATAVYE